MLKEMCIYYLDWDGKCFRRYTSI